MNNEIEEIEKMLAILTVQQVADKIGLSKISLQGFIALHRIDVLKLKKERALNLLTPLSGKMSFPQMAKETGLSIHKVKDFSLRYGIQSSKKFVRQKPVKKVKAKAVVNPPASTNQEWSKKGLSARPGDTITINSVCG